MTKANCLSLVFCLTILPACQAPAPTDRPTSAPTTAAAARHPLDPLTPDEVRAIAEVAKADARLAQAAFHAVTLHEPSKSEVLAWQPPAVLARQARVPGDDAHHDL